MPSPIPKRPGTRQRRNRPTTAATVHAGPAIKVDLPGREGGWHPLTLITWDVWWASPLVEEWVDADVPGLVELAALVDDFWRADKVADRAKARSEVRLSSREYGLSPLSRRSLQWEIKRVQAAERAAPQPRTRRQTEAVLGILEGGRRAG